MPTKKLRDLTTSNELLKKELQEARVRLRQRGHSDQHATAWVALNATPPQEEEETWFATYLDMMTLLLVLMLVMLAFAGAQTQSDQDIDPASAPATADSAEQDSAAQSFPADGLIEWGGIDLAALGNDIEIIVEDKSVHFRINSELLFPSGQADLSLEGLRVLKKLLPVFQHNDVLITVSGHTDSLPIRSHRFPSNWELSSARAGSVVRYLEANGTSSNRLRAIGHADTQPISDNATAKGRALNRRVELSISFD